MKKLENNQGPIPNKARTECQIFSRVVGYLRPVKQWNEGKISEFKDRTLFKIN